ncbi:hypothetical protein [Polaribacter sp. M15]
MDSFIEGLDDGYNLLESPAAQQMLIYQLDGQGPNLTTNNNNALSTAFYNEYHTMGNPTQGNIRNIAISSGSECGGPQGFTDNATMIYLDERTHFLYWQSLVLGFVQLAGWNPLKAVSSVFSTDTDIVGRFTVKSLPNQEVKQIYNGEIFISKTILWSITVHEPLIDEYSVNSEANMLPLDNASGGIYDVENFSELPDNIANSFTQRTFNFVPTYSSLNIGDGTQTITYADLNKTYSPIAPPNGAKHIPFDNFYTNVLQNENHIQFTLENGQWLMEELNTTSDKGFYSCPSDCGNNLNLEILGTNQICDTNSGNYVIQNLQGNLPISWSVYPSGVVTITNNSYNNVTITPSSNYVGDVALSAQISTSCANETFTVTKTIQVGTAMPILYDLNGNEVFYFEYCLSVWNPITFFMPGTLLKQILNLSN